MLIYAYLYSIHGQEKEKKTGTGTEQWETDKTEDGGRQTAGLRKQKQGQEEEHDGQGQTFLAYG